MAVIQSGVSSDLAVVDPGTDALRTVNAPTTQRVGDSYQVGQSTGAVATPAALGEVFQFRNSHASKIAAIERIQICMVNAVAVTAAQEFAFEIDSVTGWTGQGTLGLALTPKRRKATMNASAMAAGDIRVASSTVVLGAGTKTIDTALFSGPGPLVNAIGASGPSIVYEADVDQDLLDLGNNEGFVIRNLIAYATGSVRFHINVQWKEY